MNGRREALQRGELPDHRGVLFIVELKAAKALGDDHRAQTINYLKATRKNLALLVNFGHHPKLESERLVNRCPNIRVIRVIRG
jgi:hypothetical protein